MEIWRQFTHCQLHKSHRWDSYQSECLKVFHLFKLALITTQIPNHQHSCWTLKPNFSFVYKKSQFHFCKRQTTYAPSGRNFRRANEIQLDTLCSSRSLWFVGGICHIQPEGPESVEFRSITARHVNWSVAKGSPLPSPHGTKGANALIRSGCEDQVKMVPKLSPWRPTCKIYSCGKLIASYVSC